MKCRFCGKRIKKDSNMCEYCGKEINEGIGTDELIDAMPEIRDDFDKIAALQEKDKKKEEKKEKRAQNRKKRTIIAVVIVALILACVAGGVYFYTKIQNAEPEEPVLTTTAIDSTFQKSFADESFTTKAVLDAETAMDFIDGLKGSFNIQDARKEYKLVREMTLGSNSKIYRLAQVYEGIPVFGSEVVIMTDTSGGIKVANVSYIETKGLTTKYALDIGQASAAITEYVNAMSDDYAIVNGVKISDVEKAVCFAEDKTYLAYKSNVSGYNRNGAYIAYDVFVDGISGNGITGVVTSSFETAVAEAVTEEKVEESYIYTMSTVNDKFNWNDLSVVNARDDINISDVTDGNASPYVISVKNAVDNAYKYFDSTFGWKGMSGDGKEFQVYINPGEYVMETLPAEMAMYTNGMLMFFREDLSQGEIDYNTVVHEYTHGVISNIAGMCGTKQLNENAAIAEGLADVFAELAEAQMTGAAPDWIHGNRNLLMPDMGYHISTSEAAKIYDVQNCYEYSTIVSHMAAFMSNYIDIDTQNEIWFKMLCLMTRHTDLNDFSKTLDAVVRDMCAYSKLDISQYNSIKTGIEMLGSSDDAFMAYESMEEPVEAPIEEVPAE